MVSKEFLATYELEVSEQGALTLPAELRSALGLQAGDTVTLVHAEAGVFLIPTRLLMPEVAREMGRLLAEKGLTPASILQGLAEEGERLFKEQYGHLTAP